MKRILSLSLICAFLLTGCGGGQAQIAVQTPEETIDTAFTALKELDIDTFNACTNNKVGGGYRMLSDLFGNQNKEAYQHLAQAMVEHLSWEINTIEINSDTAVADVTIHNKDFSDSVGLFVADLIRKVNKNQQEGMDLSSLIQTTIDEAKSTPEYMLPYLQNCEKDFSVDAAITLKKTEKGWQIQLNDSLCDNLTGHLGTENFSEHVSTQISAVEELLNRNLERWGVEENTNQWKYQLETMITGIFK